jgi:hypothetical protein
VAVPNVPPFVSLADALQWSLERITRAGLERGPYFDHAAAALDDARRGQVFIVREGSRVRGPHKTVWHVAQRRDLFAPAAATWSPTGIDFDDSTPFPQAKAAERAGILEMKLRENLLLELRRAAVRALEAAGLDPLQEFSHTANERSWAKRWAKRNAMRCPVCGRTEKTPYGDCANCAESEASQ